MYHSTSHLSFYFFLDLIKMNQHATVIGLEPEQMTTAIDLQRTDEQGKLSSISGRVSCSISGWVERLPSAHGKPSCAIRHAGAWGRLWNNWVLRWGSANGMVGISAVVAIILATASASASTSSPSPLLPHSTLVMGAILSLCNSSSEYPSLIGLNQ
jgi:hypothetical protein